LSHTGVKLASLSVMGLCRDAAMRPARERAPWRNAPFALWFRVL